MQDIKKEEFCFDLYNQLQDEFGMVDKNGTLANQIQSASGQKLNDVLLSLQQELVNKMKPLRLFSEI